MKSVFNLSVVLALALGAFSLQFCQNAERSAPAAPAAEQSAAAPAEPPAPPQSRGDFDKKKASSSQDQLETESIEEAGAFQTAVAAVGKIDSLKKFVRTADLKFRVADVLHSTLEIENTALKNGGFVIQSNLSNRSYGQKTTSLSRDSSIESMTIAPECRLVLRVPFFLLDTTLRAIGRQCELMDFRNVSAEDIGLQLMENQLIALRQKIYEASVSGIAEPPGGAKSSTRLEAAGLALQSHAATDGARLDNLKIEDKIRFSTVSVHIYQLPRVRQQVVANVQNQVARPPFGRRLAQALATGGEIVEVLVLGIFSLWPLVLAGLAVWFFVVRKQRKTASA